MSVVAGVDFGTLSVRASIIDSAKGRLGTGTAEYPLHRRRVDPDYATQSHDDQMAGLADAMTRALADAALDGRVVEALAIDTTGSSVIIVDKLLRPLSDYYLWCDHRAWREAASITETARRERLAVIDWCGGIYSSEWGWAKLLHWLRHNPGLRDRAASAFENVDMVVATLCGITDPVKVTRSVCAAGHKWLWNKGLGGFPPSGFLKQVDPLLAAFLPKMAGACATSDHIAGGLSSEWAVRLGLKSGIPIPVGAFDAHWDALGAGGALGDVVNITGTSTCIIAMSERPELVPGLCGVVEGSVDPGLTGIEAGMSATGDIFDAIARRAGQSPAILSYGLERYRVGETGLLRIPWDNGDRTILVNPEVSGATLGWNLTHTPQDELFAAIEGSAFHTRLILEHMEAHHVPIRRVINGGGIPQRNSVLNQVYANVLNKPVLVPNADVTSLGAAIFAFLAAGAYSSVRDAQAALCPAYRTFAPDPGSREACDELFALFSALYHSLGRVGSPPVSLGGTLPALRRIAARSRAEHTETPAH